MMQSFECPSCGGPLDYNNGAELTIRCPFCSNSVIVPEELRAMPAAAQSNFFSNLQGNAHKFAELARMVRANRKIEAIKLYREIFGVGLKEAKEAVERMAAGQPAIFTAQAQTSFGSDISQSLATPQAQRAIKTVAGISLAMILVPILIVVLVGGIIAFTLYRVTSSVKSSVRSPTSSSSKSARGSKGAGGGAAGFADVALEFGSEGTGPGHFQDARSIAVDGQGNIYVGEYTGGRVQVFDSAGNFITQWMVDTKMPLRGLAADRRGTVYVVQHGVISRYEGMTGKQLGQLTYSGGNGFDDVRATADGGLVAAWYSNRDDIVRFNSSGQATRTIREAISGQSGDSELDTRVAVDGLGNIYALGTFNNSVFKFAPDGKYITRFGGVGEKPGQFRAPDAIAVDSQGRVYVSDIKGIQVFDANGRYLDVFKVDGGVAFGMVFNDKNELLVAARNKVVKFSLDN